MCGGVVRILEEPRGNNFKAQTTGPSSRRLRQPHDDLFDIDRNMKLRTLVRHIRLLEGTKRPIVFDKDSAAVPGCADTSSLPPTLR